MKFAKCYLNKYSVSKLEDLSFDLDNYIDYVLEVNNNYVPERNNVQESVWLRFAKFPQLLTIRTNLRSSVMRLSLRDQFLLYCFTYGLKPDIETSNLIHDATSLDEAISLAHIP